MILFNFYHQAPDSFSINAAAPIPVAVHIEMTPYFCFYLFNSGSRVATSLAPVQPKELNDNFIPKGCPKAIAPPLGFIFLISSPSF
jgi:hypothetical protein